MTDSDNCNCCEGTVHLTPASLENLPGQSQLTYRVGTHSSFKQSMKAAIVRQPALNNLTTRDDDDPSIALLDAWATTLDVLTFYQERIANEGFLRTSTERRSILELARSIGYELRPGVAASTYLAFELESASGAPEKVNIPMGTKAQTVPGQDESPQTFETVEAIEARPVWNKLKAKTTKKIIFDRSTTEIFLKSPVNPLRVGDALLIVGDEYDRHKPDSERWDFRLISQVTPADGRPNIIKVELNKSLGAGRTPPAHTNVRIFVFRQRAALFGYNAPDWRVMPDSVKVNFLAAGGSSAEYLDNATLAGNPMIPSTALYPLPPSEWPGLTINDISGSGATIHLDAVYPQIVPATHPATLPAHESWLILCSPTHTELYEINTVTEDACQNFTLTSKTMRLTLTGKSLERFNTEVRKTVVYAASEPLTIVEATDLSPVLQGSNHISIETPVENLGKGRRLVIAGISNDNKPVSEPVIFDEIDPTGTQIRFHPALAHTYKPESLVIYANVAAATHGETKTEVLGSGDASQPFQKFFIKPSPLTYTASDQTPSGAISSLTLRVNDIKWDEVPSLYGLRQQDRKYITRIMDDGKMMIAFGDGPSGTRLPSGIENIKATYRVGIGMPGMVKAGQISLLMTRPLGVKGVFNPMAPEGAQNAQTRDEARQNAPLTVLTLDRIVSLRDFEDFARAFSGIGKAQAVSHQDGHQTVVHIIVAAANGQPASSEQRLHLSNVIKTVCDPTQHFVIETFVQRTFQTTLKVKFDPHYLKDNVTDAIKRQVADSFSFEKRSFGQSVTPSEMIAFVQNVAGVIYVDLEYLQFTGTSTTTLHPQTLYALPNELLVLASLPDNVQVLSLQ